MRICCIADEASKWCPAVILDQYRHSTRHTYVANPFQADLIWIHSYYLNDYQLLSPLSRLTTHFSLPPHRHQRLQNIPIITTIHHLSPQKELHWRPLIQRIATITDIWHLPSPSSVTDGAKYLTKPAVHLPYWIDQRIFHPLSVSHRMQLRQQHQIPPDALVIGSFQRDTEADKTTPKKEKGPDIFCDIVEKLPRQKLFILLSGERRQYIEKRLTQAGIKYKNVGKIPFVEMNNLYNVLDYYLVTSRHEGGPQAVLETAAARVKIFSTPVGITPSFLSQDVIIPDTESFLKKLTQPYPSRALEAHFDQATVHNHRRIISQYDDYFERLITHSAPATIVDSKQAAPLP